MTKRDEIRGKIFASRKPKSKTIQINGVEVEIRQPNLATMEKIYLRSPGEQGSIDTIVNVLIELAYIPGTNEKVFDESDIESIKSLPVDSWVSELGDIIGNLINVDVGEARKNS